MGKPWGRFSFLSLSKENFGVLDLEKLEDVVVYYCLITAIMKDGQYSDDTVGF
jgi:hypothetical protein